MKTNTFYDLDTSQYKRLLSFDGKDREEFLAILENKKKSQITMRDIAKWSGQDLKVFTPPTEIIGFPLYVHGNTLYGLQDVSKLTYGEFTDLINYVKDPVTNLTSIMAILWRPVSQVRGLSFYKAKLAQVFYKRGKVEWANRLIKSISYTIEDYDALQADLRHRNYDKFPSWIAHQTMGFILVFSETWAIDFLKSLQKEIKEKTEEMKTPGEL